MADKEIDEISGTETTGARVGRHQGAEHSHAALVGDHLYITIVWGVLYMIAYPSVPWFNGLLNYSSRASVAEEMALAVAEQAQYVDRIADMPSRRSPATPIFCSLPSPAARPPTR